VKKYRIFEKKNIFIVSKLRHITLRDMDMLKLRTPAKINLFLNVLGMRPDGFHDICSWFQAIDLFDNLTFTKGDKRGLNLYCEGAYAVPTGDGNLITKTARLMLDRFVPEGGIDIILQKNIPVAAGMAGGSSDSAATIYAINKLFELDLDTSEMIKIGLELGSDIPFFFSSGQAEVTGRGDKIRDINLPFDYSIALVVPKIAVSTKESYERLNLGLTSSDAGVKFSACSDFADLVAQIMTLGNDFETNHFSRYPVLTQIGRMLKSAGALLARMSGSGPTMFGLFGNKPDEKVFSQLTQGEWDIFFVRPISLPAWDGFI